jgi:hypothetical protein
VRPWWERWPRRDLWGSAAEDRGETSGSVSVTGEASEGPFLAGVGVGCALRLVCASGRCLTSDWSRQVT